MIGIEIFLIILALIWLIFAVISDLKTREVPNWLNFSLIIFALGIRLFYSLFDENWNYFLQGLIGFAVFFTFGNLLYYARFFGGGDAKLMIALGAILPFEIGFFENLNLFAIFFFLFFTIGALYSFIFVFYFSFKNFSKIKKEFCRHVRTSRKIFFIFMIIGLIFMLFSFIGQTLFFLGILLFAVPYLFFYTKSIDNISLVQKIESSKLKEGDWLSHDIKIGKKILKSNWEGLSRKEIAFLKKKQKYVLIKRGIEFTPVFLASFFIYVYFYLINITLSYFLSSF